MFGIPSIGKLLVLGLIIAGVYLFFKAAKRRDISSAGRGQGNSGGSPAQNQENQSDSGSLEMVQCPACKAYIPAKSTCSCGGNG
ncbi:hypothetical protein [Kiloniella antarctica]|uniref:Uncharacterized protein n=1 Tax=Kiloniella antarctica TaxID=1550907 RepID=A0ABW5BJ07_9PROT